MTPFEYTVPAVIDRAGLVDDRLIVTAAPQLSGVSMPCT